MKMRTAVWVMVIIVLALGSAVAASSGAEEEAGPWSVAKLIWRVINTVVLIVVLVYFLRKPLSTFFKERTAQIEKDLEEARAQRDKAELTVKEYEAKIAAMDKELRKMHAELGQAAQLEKDKVLANAQRMAAAVTEAARIAAEQEVRKAKVALQNEAVELAIQTAETLIREKIVEADHRRIVEDYLAKVEGKK